MFENLSTLVLQYYLYFVVASIGAILVFMLYVQGGQALAILLSRTEEEKSEMLNTVGKRYEITFTSLVVFGGSFFAIFPLFYSTSFGGAYFVWFALLFLFIVEGVSFKYRSKVSNFLGARTYEMFLLFNGIGAPLLIGVAVATFFTGAHFTINRTNLIGSQAVSRWDSSWHGLEALWNPIQGAWLTNISFGVAVVLLTTILASLNIIKNVIDPILIERVRQYLVPATFCFLVAFLFFISRLVAIDGFAYDAMGTIFMEPYKYLHNMIALPTVSFTLLLGVILVVTGIILGYFWTYRRSFWIAGFGTFLVTLTLFLLAGYNNTAFYPSLSDLQSSLTIMNASSSRYTLVAISYATLLAPIVLIYVAYVWHALRDDGISQDFVKKNVGDLY